MFMRPQKTKSSRKTLNFGPKIIEIGPGSSENEPCKDREIPCNFLVIFHQIPANNIWTFQWGKGGQIAKFQLDRSPSSRDGF